MTVTSIVPRLNLGRHRTTVSYWLAVAFFVFFAGAAGAGIVAADFGAGADGFWRFGLRGAGLILQVFLLALLFAFELARYVGQTLRRRLRWRALRRWPLLRRLR